MPSMNAPISRLFPIAAIISLRSEEKSPHLGQEFQSACYNALSAIKGMQDFPNRLKEPLVPNEIRHYHDTILGADSLTYVLWHLERSLPFLSYLSVPDEIIFEDIHPLYNSIMGTLDWLSEVPEPWHGELDIFARGVRDFFSEDGQVIKKFIELAYRVMIAFTQNKTLEAESLKKIFDTYCHVNKIEIHQWFHHIYKIFLEVKNRIRKDMKPQADKIIEDTCRALFDRLTA